MKFQELNIGELFSIDGEELKIKISATKSISIYKTPPKTEKENSTYFEKHENNDFVILVRAYCYDLKTMAKSFNIQN